MITVDCDGLLAVTDGIHLELFTGLRENCRSRFVTFLEAVCRRSYSQWMLGLETGRARPVEIEDDVDERCCDEFNGFV